MKRMAAFLFVIFILSPFHIINAQPDAARIVLVKGEPKIMKKGSSEWMSCKRNMGLDTGDRIKTSVGEEVGISYFEDSSIVNMSENSDAVLVVSMASSSVDLVSGEVMVLARRLPKGSTFEVKAPTGLSGARGTGWGVNTDGKTSQFSAYESSIYVKGIDRSGNIMSEELIIDEGFRTSLGAFERPERIERLSERDMDRWNSFREVFIEPAAERSAEKSVLSDDRNKLDRLSMEDARIEGLQSDKQDISESRDVERIAERMSEQPPAVEERADDRQENRITTINQ